MSRPSIPVQILGQEYRVRSGADEAVVRRAATLVDQTMKRIQDRTRTVDTLDVAVLAALHLANDVVRFREQGSAATPSVETGRMRTLIDLVESVVAGSRSASS